jgi:hypothetical protein
MPEKEVENMAKKKIEEKKIQEDNKERTFDEFKEAIFKSDELKMTVDDWNAMLDEIMRSKGISDGEMDRLKGAIEFRIKEAGEKAQEEAEATPEPVIINDGLRHTRHKKVMAVSSKTEKVKVLGYMAGFTVGASAVPNKVVDEFWEEHNLPANTKPNVAHPLDAFARACQTLKKDEVRQVEKGQVQCSWNVNGLDARTYMITRRILIEDEKGKRDLGWQNIARCVLEGEGEAKNFKIAIKPEGNQKGLKTICEGIQKEVRAIYQTYMENVMDKQIRDALRNTIYRANGIGFTMGRGGAWFVPLHAQSILEGWREFARLVNNQYTLGGYPVSIRLIPLADADEYKEMVAEDVQREVHDRMEGLLNSTLEALEKAQSRAKDGKVKDDTLDKMLGRKLEEHASTIEMLEEYKAMLGTNIRIDLKKLGERLDKVEVPLSERHQVALRKLASLQSTKPAEKKGKAKKSE